MRKNVLIPVVMVLLAAVVLLVVANARDDDGTAVNADAGTSRSERLVRPDSQRLSTAPGSDVTFVEFLDFECEACGAAYPAVEQLRKDYGDRVTFVVRYMPLHNNSEAASLAAEAAAEQGKFEEMYGRLFETQKQWGEKDTSQKERFFGFAEDLGLDMERFRRVYDDDATIQRVRRDKADGEALGVTGTPTFFVDGKKLEIRSFGDLVDALDDALA